MREPSGQPAEGLFSGGVGTGHAASDTTAPTSLPSPPDGPAGTNQPPSVAPPLLPPSAPQFRTPGPTEAFPGEHWAQVDDEERSGGPATLVPVEGNGAMQERWASSRVAFGLAVFYLLLPMV